MVFISGGTVKMKYLDKDLKEDYQLQIYQSNKKTFEDYFKH